MNGEPAKPQVVYERCLCRQAVDFVLSAAGLKSERARQHFRNSRVEVLKGIRAIIDDRIDRLSARTDEGASIQVE